jgi:DHA2 family multidrug resistance protein
MILVQFSRLSPGLRGGIFAMRRKGGASKEELAMASLAASTQGQVPALQAEMGAQERAAPGGLKMWVAVVGATLGAFMAVLNIQIVNTSLADIQGAIGAGADDGGWISTSYLIAEIVVIPLSSWLAQVFSLRLYLLVNAALFLIFSVACASRMTSAR